MPLDVSQPLRIGNAAGFLGDWLDAPRRMVESTPVDFLTLEYLAELTLSILAHQRAKNPEHGFARDFLDVLQSIAPALARQRQLHVVTNAGGMNPLACAVAASRLLVAAGLADVRLGAVLGDDLLEHFDQLSAAGCDWRHIETGDPLPVDRSQIASANAYLGAAPIVDALAQSARIVITGRVADVSLTVAPALHRFGWKWDDWRRLAAASVAGHVIECGAQATGGYSVDWRDYPLANVGYPIAEISLDGSVVIAKTAGSDGAVNRRTVVEQLLYEIGDPRNYVTPDVTVDFTTILLDQLGDDRVGLGAFSGKRPPDSFKVSLAYRDGFTASGQLLVFGLDAVEKAHRAAHIILDRLRSIAMQPARYHVELLGAGDAVPQVSQSASFQSASFQSASFQSASFQSTSLQSATSPPVSPRREAERSRRCTELILRITAFDADRAKIERFTKEIAPLATSGPAGLAGYAAGRSSVRPVLAYWPASIPKSLLKPHAVVRSAREWIDRQGAAQ